MKRLLWLVVLMGTAVEASEPVRGTSLTGGWQAVLQEQVARARLETPEAFTRLDVAAARVEVLDARKRGMLAPVSPALKDLGREALWPMVERLAFATERLRQPSTEPARLALKVGLVEAAGELRDARLAPLWKSLLEGPDIRRPVLRSAAVALARLETLDAAQALIELSRRDGVHGEAAREALGHCRRLVAARALAQALDARPAPAEALRLARALGDAGSAWAWKTSAVQARSEEGAVRRVAAEALVRAYLDYEGDTRRALSNAVLRVDAPETPSLIDSARSRAGSEAQRAALEALSERLRTNPLR